jgi:hypothetical protein
MFIARAFIPECFDFSPKAVFLLFGLSGLTAEAGLNGAQALAEFGLWIFVYGPMVSIPAYTFPDRPGARKPLWWMYPAAVFLPVLCAVPVVLVIGILHPVKIHFPRVPAGS